MATTNNSYTLWVTHTLVASAEAKFSARQAAEQLLAFQMQQSEAELGQSDVRYVIYRSCKDAGLEVA